MTHVSGNVGLALTLTVLAGLSTGIGSAVAYFIRRPRIGYLSFSLGLSAGVMIYISFVELLPDAAKTIGQLWAVIIFFVGMVFMGLIDMLVPEVENPHHYEALGEPGATAPDHRLMRTGIFTALAIGIHNLPEGLATFASTLSDVKLGVFIAFAIAIHNIPEGMAVSMPIFYATGNKNKAFFYSFLSGLSEPVGALIGFLILMPFLNQSVLAGVMVFIAGIMIYLSLDELLPMAHRYGRSHLVIIGVMSGMFIMAVSLLLL
jgi:ZIP family zinc transporter